MPIIDPSYTIAEFCAAEHITAPTFYKLKRAGLGPKEMRHGAAIRISPRAPRMAGGAREADRGTAQNRREIARASPRDFDEVRGVAPAR